MPFKSEKQRRWMFANKPEMAKRWARDYYDGGIVTPNEKGGFATPVYSYKDGGYVRIPTVNFADGGELNANQILIRDPRWSVVKDLIPGAKGIFTGLEELVELPGTLWSWITGKEGYDVDLTPQQLDDANDEALALAIEILSDYYGPEKGAQEAMRLFENSEFVGSFIDPIALLKAPKVLKALSKYDLEIDPNTLGMGGGNIRIVKKGRPSKTRTIVMQTPDGDVFPVTGDNAAEMIADATGKSKKTVQNALANNKPIKSSDGTIFREAKEGDNLGPIDVTDARKIEGRLSFRTSPDGDLVDFDGTFSDLMREYDIDPRSSHASGIRQKLQRSGEWEAPDGKVYRRNDVEAPEARKDRNLRESIRRGVGRTVRRKEALKEMQYKIAEDLGLPPEAHEEFRKAHNQIWTYYRRGGDHTDETLDRWLSSPVSAKILKVFKQYAPEKLPQGSIRDKKIWLQKQLRKDLLDPAERDIIEARVANMTDDELGSRLDEAVEKNRDKKLMFNLQLDLLREKWGAYHKMPLSAERTEPPETLFQFMIEDPVWWQFDNDMKRLKIRHKRDFDKWLVENGYEPRPK